MYAHDFPRGNGGQPQRIGGAQIVFIGEWEGKKILFGADVFRVDARKAADVKAVWHSL